MSGRAIARPAALRAVIPPTAAVAAVAALVYSRTLSHGFVFDDVPLIATNPILSDVRNLVPLLGLDGRLPAPRALRTALDLFDFTRGGGGARAFHETSVALHAVASVLVYFLGRAILPGGRGAFPGALAFALHPVHADAVAFVSGRKDVLATLLGAGSLLAFLRHRDSGRTLPLVSSVVLLGLALLAKEMAAAIPLLALLLDARLPEKGSEQKPGVAGALRKRAAAHALAFGLAAGAAILAVFVYRISALVGPGGYSPIGGGAAAHALTALRVAARAATVLLLPVRLRGDYSHAVIEPSAGFGLAEAGAIALLVTLAVAVLALGRRATLAAPLALAALLAYLPVSHVLPHHEMFSEHTLYLPSVFACLAFGLWASSTVPRFGHRPRLAAPAAAGVLILLGARAFDRAADYRDHETWVRAILREAPECSRARYNLGEMHRTAGRAGEAEEEYLRAIEIGSRNPAADRTLSAAWNQAGLVRYTAYLEQKGAGRERDGRRDLDSAVERFSRAAELAGRSEGPHANLAVALLERGDLAAAAEAANAAERNGVRSYHVAYVGALSRAMSGADCGERLGRAAAALARAEAPAQRAEAGRLVLSALAAAGEPEAALVAWRFLRADLCAERSLSNEERRTFLRDARRSIAAREGPGAARPAARGESLAALRSIAVDGFRARRERRRADAVAAGRAFTDVLEALGGEVPGAP